MRYVFLKLHFVSLEMSTYYPISKHRGRGSRNQKLFKGFGSFFFFCTPCTPISESPEHALSRILSIAHDGLKILMSVHFEFISVLSSIPRLQGCRKRGGPGNPRVFPQISIKLSRPKGQDY